MIASTRAVEFAFSALAALLITASQASLANAPHPDGIDPSKVVIADTFERQPVAPDSIVVAANGCLRNAQMAFSSSSWKLPSPGGAVSITTTTGTPNLFGVVGDQAMCIQETSSGFPILPVEVFLHRTTFNGVEISKQKEWFRQIAKGVALTGSAELAVTNGSGGTHVFTYSAPVADRGRLTLGRRFFAPGESRDDPKPQAINVTAPEMTSIFMLERRAQLKLEANAHSVSFPMPTFFSSPDVSPQWRIRVERSAETGLLVAPLQ